MTKSDLFALDLAIKDMLNEIEALEDGTPEKSTSIEIINMFSSIYASRVTEIRKTIIIQRVSKPYFSMNPDGTISIENPSDYDYK
jgi:hypothetical protein